MLTVSETDNLKERKNLPRAGVIGLILAIGVFLVLLLPVVPVLVVLPTVLVVVIRGGSQSGVEGHLPIVIVRRGFLVVVQNSLGHNDAGVLVVTLVMALLVPLVVVRLVPLEVVRLVLVDRRRVGSVCDIEVSSVVDQTFLVVLVLVILILVLVGVATMLLFMILDILVHMTVAEVLAGPVIVVGVSLSRLHVDLVNSFLGVQGREISVLDRCGLIKLLLLLLLFLLRRLRIGFRFGLAFCFGLSFGL